MVRKTYPGLVIIILTLATVRAHAADLFKPTTLDHKKVNWHDLHFGARKLGISATVDVRLNWATMIQPPESLAHSGKPKSPAGQIRGELVLESQSHLPGRHFFAIERVDPVTGAAHQIIDTETGLKHHRKTYTLNPEGFLYDLRQPAFSEGDLPADQWSKQTTTYTTYPKSIASDVVVTGPNGLLYAISAAGLANPGDSLAIHVLVQAQVELVTVQVEGVQPTELKFDQIVDGTTNTITGTINLIRMTARSHAMDDRAKSAFRLFGLEGEVEILWDPERNLPVQISGQVKYFGQISVRLVSATLRYP